MTIRPLPIRGGPKGRLRGVALLIVMLLTFAMAVIVTAFAYTMKVEGRLATRTQSESETEWMGRSGIELAKWVLSLSRQIPGEQAYDGLNQFWAGGVAQANLADNPFEGVSLKDVPLGDGTISVEIVDAERYLNINAIATRNPQLFELILQLCGAGASDSADVSSAIRDWIDPNDDSAMGGGAESDFYRMLNPPYVAKNGPIDDMSELLKIRGITPQLYWGPRWSGGSPMPSNRSAGRREQATFLGQGIAGTVGLVDVFSAVSSGQVNINTAPFPVLVMACGGDENIARNIMEQRAGPDGVDGTYDDTPARGPQDIARLQGVPSLPTQGTPLAVFSTVSSTFEVRVDAKLGAISRRYVGVLRRSSLREMPVLTFRRE
ncbi:MAG: general secretion pathway protein GspK [Verrucomicrobiota bacterium]